MAGMNRTLFLCNHEGSILWAVSNLTEISIYKNEDAFLQFIDLQMMNFPQEKKPRV